MWVRRLVAATMTALLAGCGTATAAPGSTPGSRSAPSAGPAPATAYPVGVHTFTLDPGGARPLPVTVWYPAARGAVAPGRFPVVIFSHGLDSLPALHAPLTSRWAAAGFVVAAPAYPHTRRGAARFTRADVRHQPADGWRLIRHLVRLDTRRGDPLAGHLDVARFAAAGHSAGGFTTAGMLTSGHPPRLRAGIVLAGGGLAGAFAGPTAPVLFVHGDADPVVGVAAGPGRVRPHARPGRVPHRHRGRPRQLPDPGPPRLRPGARHHHGLPALGVVRRPGRPAPPPHGRHPPHPLELQGRAPC
ncbi:alpha/beta hydrolase family protein [Micromonospora haikouensis]|uniref:alpha/beta hydrolase family protein n=1 Tax=Micromonospora haikouensis TaxID=686309 RepID=UPI00378EA360